MVNQDNYQWEVLDHREGHQANHQCILVNSHLWDKVIGHSQHMPVFHQVVLNQHQVALHQPSVNQDNHQLINRFLIIKYNSHHRNTHRHHKVFILVHTNSYGIYS